MQFSEFLGYTSDIRDTNELRLTKRKNKNRFCRRAEPIAKSGVTILKLILLSFQLQLQLL